MGRLEEKVAIITGTASGMGRVAAILFAKEGAKVVGADCNVEGGEETLRIVKKSGGDSIFVKADISKTEDAKNMVKVGIDTYKKLDIIYNNAGIAQEIEAVPVADVEPCHRIARDPGQRHVDRSVHEPRGQKRSAGFPQTPRGLRAQRDR